MTPRQVELVGRALSWGLAFAEDPSASNLDDDEFAEMEAAVESARDALDAVAT